MTSEFLRMPVYVQGVNGSQWVIQTMLEDVSLRNDL